MELLIVRHAKATDQGGMADAYRPLTSRGRRDARHVGEALRREKLKVESIIASPLVRAVETAELIAVGLEWDGALEIAPELSPIHPATGVLDDLLAPRLTRDGGGTVAVVGHEPQLGELLQLLLGSWVPSPRKASATLCTWSSVEERARFRWVIHPDSDGPSKKLEDVG